jgi:hypothetical protein
MISGATIPQSLLPRAAEIADRGSPGTWRIDGHAAAQDAEAGTGRSAGRPVEELAAG